jgi:hypothetical protein
VQPVHLDLIHALVDPEKANVAPSNDQRLDRDQWWQVFALPVQKTDSFSHAPRRKVGFAEAADLDGSGESVLQCRGDSRLRVWPVPNQHDQHYSCDDYEECAYNQPPPSGHPPLSPRVDLPRCV